jgi:hypothetical protein
VAVDSLTESSTAEACNAVTTAAVKSSRATAVYNTGQLFWSHLFKVGHSKHLWALFHEQNGELIRVQELESSPIDYQQCSHLDKDSIASVLCTS